MKGTRIGIGRTAEVYEWSQGRIIKLYRDGYPPDEAENEAKLARIVAATDLPVPQVYGAVEVEGKQGVIYERIDGESMLARLMRQPLQIPALSRQFATIHRRIHMAHTPELPSQRHSIQRAILAAPVLTDEQKTELLRRLVALPDGDTVCHGDYHPDNLLITSKGNIVIDWVNGRRGNPMADVARTYVILRFAQPLDASPRDRLMLGMGRSLILRSYLSRYFAGQAERRAEMERWIPIMAAARLREVDATEAGELVKAIEARLGSPD